MKKKKSNLFITVLIGIMSLISVSMFWRFNFALTIILILLAIFMLLINKSKREIKTFIFCSIFGASAEVFAIFFGAWTYGNPSFVGIPIWLAILWGIASIFTVRIFLSFND